MLDIPGQRFSPSISDSLVDEILLILKGRTAVVDACVSREIARKLIDSGISARHVTDLDPQMSDHEIEKLMLPSDVLITKDVNFAKSLKDRAILLPLQPPGEPWKRDRKVAKIARTRLPKEVRIGAKEQVAKELSLGIIQLKILCGLLMIFEMRILSIEEVKEIHRSTRLVTA